MADTLAKGDYVIVTGVNNNGQAGDDYWIIQKAQTSQDMINSIDRHNVNNACYLLPAYYQLDLVTPGISPL